MALLPGNQNPGGLASRPAPLEDPYEQELRDYDDGIELIIEADIAEQDRRAAAVAGEGQQQDAAVDAQVPAPESEGQRLEWVSGFMQDVQKSIAAQNRRMNAVLREIRSPSRMASRRRREPTAPARVPFRCAYIFWSNCF